MKLNPATTLVALALIGAGGFMVGRMSIPKEPEVGSVEERAERYLRSGSSRADGPGGTDRTREDVRRESRETASMSPAERLNKLEMIVRGENALDRNRALLDYIDQLGPGEFQDAVAHFRSLGITESRMGEYSLLLTAWAKLDPTSALAYAEENTRGGFARDTVLSSWATNDPEAAIRWADANHEGDGANPYMIGVIRGLAGTDPVRATNLLAEMPYSGERGAALQAMLPHIMSQGTEAASKWITEIEDPRLRNGALMSMAGQLAQEDPEGTAKLLLANPGDATNRRLDDVYAAYMNQDKAKALSSFNSLPAGEERSNALRGMVNSLTNQDPKAGEALMNQYPNDVNDNVVQQFVWNSQNADPALAVNNISRIGDENQRNQMYRRMLGRWIRRDAAGAQAWIQNNPLPNDVQQRAYQQLNEAQQRQQ